MEEGVLCLNFIGRGFAGREQFPVAAPRRLFSFDRFGRVAQPDLKSCPFQAPFDSSRPGVLRFHMTILHAAWPIVKSADMARTRQMLLDRFEFCQFLPLQVRTDRLGGGRFIKRLAEEITYSGNFQRRMVHQPSVLHRQDPGLRTLRNVPAHALKLSRKSFQKCGVVQVCAPTIVAGEHGFL